MLILVVTFGVLQNVAGILPNGCHRLEDLPLDTADPGTIFGINNELNQKAPPHRTGNLRSQRPLPTQHFASNAIKASPVPMILYPYEALMESEGMVYDAYTLDRWYDPDRSDMMLQQSASIAGQSWNKIWSLGTNMKQMTSGPDGNKGGVFTGKSGVRIGISGSSEPVMTDFGDLFANFEYHGNSGTMEVPLVRGSALLTHIFKNADPVIKPYCLSNINGHQTHFDCPKEASAFDGGSGHLSGTCSGGTLHITLDSDKPIHDITRLQYSVNSLSNWRSGKHGMRNCDTNSCHMSNEDKRVTINIPNSHGQMAFAVNYIGHYLLPGNWVPNPEQVTCSGKRDTEYDANEEVHEKRESCHPDDISASAVCDVNRNIDITIDLGSNDIPIEAIQYAMEGSDVWHHPPAMYNCKPDHCTRTGKFVHIKLTTSSNNFNYAINFIGCTTVPVGNWIDQPLTGTCGGSVNTPSPTVAPTQSPVQTHNPVITNPTQAPHNTGTGTVQVKHGSKFIMELNEPGDELPNQTRKYLLYFSQPVTPHVNQGQSTINFTPTSGGKYNGIVQLAYLGASPRGDTTHNNDLDKYLGVYSYKPSAAYCVSEEVNKTFVSFDWNPNNQHADNPMGELMMVTMPHHALILKKDHASHLKSTVYGFEGYVGSSWLMEMDMPRAAMEPENAAVNMIKGNAQQNKDMLDAIAKDASETILDQICGRVDSYGGGKEIGMLARLASISRAFNTNHYQKLDSSIKSCLEKWLRIDDTLYEMWKFRYDSVWGGMFLRSTNSRTLDFASDFGFTFYNDHHFHIGYFLYALAYYVRHDQAWGKQHKHRIYALARDVGNLSYKDKHFPVARHKDVYTGFSWASGIAPGVRQEESSSEGLNCYHALAALGDAYKDSRLKHTGQVLLAMEIASVREYWHVRDHNYNHFPPLIQKSGAVGMIGEQSFYLYTLNWPCDPNVFPQRHACLIGIQVMPITSVSKYWLDKDWAKHVLNSCTEAVNPSSAKDYHLTGGSKQLNSGWKAFCYVAMAPYDAAHATEAANYVKQQSPHHLVGGTSTSSTLLFIYGRT
ncbi:uncharacterized protein [Mytilus edulis]|uniref:uncharacterized protein n=1 Tax=Mytilus edulis TaxID=6550 RepID=UPI0039F10443